MKKFFKKSSSGRPSSPSRTPSPSSVKSLPSKDGEFHLVFLCEIFYLSRLLTWVDSFVFKFMFKFQFHCLKFQPAN